jgi:outer membrane receptor protein involved in Fe transport
MRIFLLQLLLILLITVPDAYSQRGKISGTVKDAATGEALIGANVIIEGTTIGAATNIQGFYSILNVAPGSYTLRFSSLGYSPAVITDVRVNIDLTTNIDVQLNETTIETEEVIVVAQAPVVKQDVSSSVANLTVEDIQNLPTVQVQNIVAFQAGIQMGEEGPLVRGGGSEQTAFVLNGIALRDERDNTPFTGVSMTAIEQVQIQTGGFNAEYGNIRSGLINVVTREGDKARYNFSFLGRYRPAGPKQLGPSPNSPESYWVKPYLDPAVAWTGTDNGAWDAYTQKQYQEFRGWNRVSEELMGDTDPTNDLTPEAAQRLFQWQHRRMLDIVKPDFDIDMTLSGPVPGLNEYLGNLRFLGSYRTSREMYFIPLSRDAYIDHTYHLKMTSDVSQGIKLSVEGLVGQQTGTGSSRSGGPGIFRTPLSIADELDIRAGASYLDARIFATDYWAPSTIDMNMIGGKMTHVLSNSTFYEILINRISFNYDTNPGRARNTDKIYQIGDAFFDESPYGTLSGTSAGIGSSMNMGLGFSNSRDSSKLNSYTFRFDIASQLNQFNYGKAGIEVVYSENNVNSALVEPSLGGTSNVNLWSTTPVRAAIYLQDKLEFEGMIANLGLRVDYSHSGGEWYDLSDPYNLALSASRSPGLDTLVEKQPTEVLLNFSPRLGIAFPITVDSKLYFNYGHFYQMPNPANLFLLQRSREQLVTYLADPNIPLPRTVQYELGYEQNLYDQFLLRVAGYYKDVSNQPRNVLYTNRNNLVNYSVPEPNSYADVRGFEVTLNKNRGSWIRGFLNYTYSIQSSGFFGLSRYSENAALQRDYERDTRAFEQDKPVPQPYARANVDFFTPREFGPQLGGMHLLGELRLNVLASWISGRYFSWTGPGGTAPGYQNNIQWSDFFNIDMRLSKTFSIGPANMEFFMDVLNVFNVKYLTYRAGFVNAQDWDDYMTSLHLPSEVADKFNYGNIPGDDKPGDYRTGPYIAWDENASESQKDEWRENKSYIDMPNLSYLTFLNPRDIRWGLRFIIEL